MHTPTRNEALSRLSQFLDRAPQYAARRNYVDPALSGVSRLSPYISRRALSEERVLSQTLNRYPFRKVEKFIQEVVWRTYWKGWLQARPWVWESYLEDLERLSGEGSAQAARFDKQVLQQALTATTQLEYFNSWVMELRTTGYLHNHVRMWFASIWIFTLGLPWQLGAKFFLEHLVDGDPAANTLSWRWVAGLQTPGKRYVARAGNIRRYTEYRWSPHEHELCADPAPLTEVLRSPQSPRQFIPEPKAPSQLKTCTLLLHDEDLCFDTNLNFGGFRNIVALSPSFSWRAHRPSPPVTQFVQGLFDDAVASIQLEAPVTTVSGSSIASVDEIAASCGSSVVCFRPLVGFLEPRFHALRDALAARGISLRYIDREHDIQLFPFALRGFFPYWAKVSTLLGERSTSSP